MKSLRIVIVAEPQVCSEVRQVAGALGCHVIGEAATPEDGLRLVRRTQPDQVIIQPAGKGMALLDILGHEQSIPVIGILLPQEQHLLERVIDAGAAGIVFTPLGVLELAPVLMVAASNFKQISALQQKYRLLDEELETRKLVDRAKGKLIADSGMQEGEAYRWLQKTSMDTQHTLKRVAADVLKERIEIPTVK